MGHNRVNALVATLPDDVSRVLPGLGSLLSRAILRQLMPVPSNGESGLRSRFYHRFDSEFWGQGLTRRQSREMTAAQKDEAWKVHERKRLAAWRESPDFGRPSYLRSMVTWNALNLLTWDYGQQLAEIERVLERDHPAGTPRDWRGWLDGHEARWTEMLSKRRREEAEKSGLFNVEVDITEIQEAALREKFDRQEENRTLRRLNSVTLSATERRLKRLFPEGASLDDEQGGSTGSAGSAGSIRPVLLATPLIEQEEMSWYTFCHLDPEDRHCALVARYCAEVDGGLDLVREAICDINGEGSKQPAEMEPGDVPFSGADDDADGQTSKTGSEATDLSPEDLDRRRLHRLYDALTDRDIKQDTSDLDSLDIAEVRRRLRNIEVPSTWTWNDFRELCEEIGLPVSRTNALWCSGRPVYRDGAWFVADGGTDKEVVYAQAEERFAEVGDICEEVTDLADEGTIYDYLAYNDSTRFSAGREKTAPRRSYTADELVNLHGDLTATPCIIDDNGAFTEVAGAPVRLNLETVKTNPHNQDIIRNVTFDIDQPDAIETLVRTGLVPPPTYMVENYDNGRAHVTYVLRTPVIGSGAHRTLELARELLSLLFKADPCYTDGYTKNPYSPSFLTHWGPAELLYDLDALIDLAEAALIDKVGADNVRGMTGRRDRIGIRRFLAQCARFIDGATDEYLVTSDQVEQSDAVDRDPELRAQAGESRHQYVFWKTQEFALTSWSQGRRRTSEGWTDFKADDTGYEQWVLRVRRHAYEMAAEARRLMSSKTDPYTDRQVEDTIKSVLAFFETRYTGSAERAMSTPEQRERGNRNSRRAYFLDFKAIVEAVLYDRQNELLIDEVDYTISLPEGMSVTDFQKLAKTRYAGEIDRRRCTRYLLVRNLKKRVGGRTLSDLDLWDRAEVMSWIMDHEASWSFRMIDELHRLHPGTSARLVAAYRATPELVVSGWEYDEEFAGMRWDNCTRNKPDTLMTFGLAPRTRSEVWDSCWKSHDQAGESNAQSAELVAVGVDTTDDAVSEGPEAGESTCENRRTLDENWTGVSVSPESGLYVTANA